MKKLAEWGGFIKIHIMRGGLAAGNGISARWWPDGVERRFLSKFSGLCVALSLFLGYRVIP